MVQYVLHKTLVKHSDSVNALAFTYDGSLFASGADDGVIIVFKGNGLGKEVHRFQVKAPITALLWHSRFGYTINVILPVMFIHIGAAVLSGTSTGCARITSLKDYSLVEPLQHDCK